MEGSLGVWQAWGFGVLGLFFLGYALLDGLDLGIGMAMPWLARSEREQRQLFQTIAPVWDGNEVWLVMGVAAWLALFPRAYAAALSVFYLPVMIVFFWLILRAAAVEFWARDAERRALWRWVFFAGSLIVPMGLSYLLGSAVAGLPADASGQVSFPPRVWFRPLPWCVAAAGGALALQQGLAYAAIKISGDLQVRVLAALPRARWIFTAAAALVFILAAAQFPAMLRSPLAWAGALTVGCSMAWMRSAGKAGRRPWVLVASSASGAGLWLVLGSALFPEILRTFGPGAGSLGIGNTASSPAVFMKLVIFLSGGVLAVAGLTWMTYRIFKGPVESTEEAGY